ncbi:MAG: hypothetical protein IJT43_00115 [Stomatobaculum sp.]|nr:hypothetical protein [Stomatobaculum sp.]
MKKYCTLLLGLVMGMLMAASVYAAGWQWDANGWWYQRDDGSWPASAWEKIDGEWYYFYDNGYMAHDTMIDGCYYVDAAGAYVEGAQEASISPVGTFDLNGQLIPTMPEIYPNGYYDSITISRGNDGVYRFTHINGRHPGSAMIEYIVPNVWIRYTSNYKNSVDETGAFLYDGNNIIRLRVDNSYEELIYIREWN